MLLVALILAVIGLVALVAAVVTNNELVAWVCIAASALGVIVLIVDAVRERSGPRGEPGTEFVDEAEFVAEETEVDNETGFVDGTEVDDETGFIDATEVDDATDIIVDTVVNDDTVVIDETAVIDATDFIAAEDHPEELVHDEPEYDMPDDDEPEYAESAEEAAIHVVDEMPETDRRSPSDEV